MKRLFIFLFLLAGLCLLWQPSPAVCAEEATISLEEATIEPIADRVYKMGEPVEPGITLMLNGTRIGASHYELTYENNINAGTATVYATGKDKYYGTISANFTITPAVRTPKVELAATSFEYTGKNIKPKVLAVRVGTDNVELAPSDYKVSYPTACADAGSYELTVTLQGNFSGTNTKKYTVFARSLHDADVSLAKQTYTYTGKAIKPKVIATYNGKTLKKNTDYTVTYTNNKKAGTGYVEVVGIGNYRHSSGHLSFLIRKAPQEFTAAPKSTPIPVKYSSVKKKNVTLALTKTLEISGTVGTVTYDIGERSSTAFTIDRSTGAITIAKGTPKGTYKMTLRLCATGDSNHLKCYRLVNLKIKIS